MKCQECDLNQYSKIKPYISKHPQYPCLIIDQSPGKTEETTNTVFTGGGGKVLYSLMKQAGLNKNDFHQAYLIQCRPEKDSKGKSDLPPNSTQLHNCFNYLYTLIQELKPQLILALGTTTIHNLTGKDSMMSNRGAFHPLLPKYQHDCSVLCLLRPDFIMKQRQYMDIMVNDLKLVTTFFLKGLPGVKEYNFTLDPTKQELLGYLYDEVGLPKDTTSFDIETTSLDPFQAQILGIGFSNSSHTACACYFTQNDNRIELIKSFLESPEVPKVAQNGSYDCKVLECSMNIKVRGMTHDTRLAEQILNPNMPKNLDHLRAVYTQIPAYKPTKKEMTTIGTWAKDRMLTYCCWDNVVTYQIMQEQLKFLKPNTLPLLHNLLVPLIEVINSMEIKGITVDTPQLALMYAAAIPRADAIRLELQTKYNLNPGSPKQVKTMFPMLESTDRASLEEEIRKSNIFSDLLQQILDYRDLTKGAGTFLKGVHTRILDNKIHTQYNIEGTGTGRLSSENPNLQNVPKLFRVIYIPDTPDDLLISGDFKQVELFVLAHLAPCNELLNFLLSGGDIHEEVRSMIVTHIPERLLWNARGIAKTIVFGTLYGRSANSIATYFQVSKDTATEWQRGLFNRFPGVKKYFEDAMISLKTYGYVTTPFNRKRIIQTYPQALNTPIQSTAADIVLQKLNLCHYQYHLDVRLQVHDEIVIHSSKLDLMKNATLLKQAMESPTPEIQNFQFPVEIKTGENWYQLQEVTL